MCFLFASSHFICVLKITIHYSATTFISITAKQINHNLHTINNLPIKPLKVKAPIKSQLEIVNSFCPKASSTSIAKDLLQFLCWDWFASARPRHMLCAFFVVSASAKQVSFRYYRDRQMILSRPCRESSSHFGVPVNALFIYLIGWRVYLISIILAWWESSPVQAASVRVSVKLL